MKRYRALQAVSGDLRIADEVVAFEVKAGELPADTPQPVVDYLVGAGLAVPVEVKRSTREEA